MKAILLAGRKGTRLRPLTLNTPNRSSRSSAGRSSTTRWTLRQEAPEITEVILSLNYQPGGSRRRSATATRSASRSPTWSNPRRSAPAAPSSTPAQAARRDSVIVLNGDVHPQMDLAGRHQPAPGREGEGDDRADAGGEPVGLRPGGNRRRRQRQRFLEKPRHDEITATRSTPGSTCSSPRPSSASPTATAYSSSAASHSPSLVASGRDVRRGRERRLLDRHRHPREVPQVHRDIMDDRYHAPPFARPPRHRMVSIRRPHGGRGDIQGPCFIDDGVV